MRQARIWKKVAVARFKLLLQDLPGETEGNNENFNQNSWWLSRDWNLVGLLPG
jgi:hypothetical protein